MKCLVTGLCLSRNLGGPAMGLTLMNELKKKYRNIDFTFAVTATSYDAERQWAKKYNVKIVRRDRLHIHILNKTKLLQLLRHFKYKGITLSEYIPSKNYWSEVHQEFINSVRDTDIIIDMNGISYVGDGTRNFFEGLEYYTNFYYAQKENKPFARFIQSFGPFDDWKVRIFARNEFKYLDFIPARGKSSAEFCKQIVKNQSKVYDFPDVAIILPKASDEWLEEYLHDHDLRKDHYIVLSPSSVIHNIHDHNGLSVGQNHVESFYLIAEQLLLNNEKLVFLPHMYSDNKKECDREVCRNIIDKIKNELNNEQYQSYIHLVEEDINPMEAKAIITGSKVCVVSRYHALVAAVSSKTPSVAIGWNVKYKDLLDYYDLANYAIDARQLTPESLSKIVCEKLKDLEGNKEVIAKMEALHQDNIKKVYNGFKLLQNWIDGQTGMSHEKH
ncbi:MAG: polysaccharide pyruvyl transferase family protein [Thermodesulfobacteriota bacterium]|nr:polysaccharide pyruvyl transferase family protein [Thermodesulfobacteriota bacterium]